MLPSVPISYTFKLMLWKHFSLLVFIIICCNICILASLIYKMVAMQSVAVSIRLNDKNRAPVSTGHLDVAFTISHSLIP